MALIFGTQSPCLPIGILSTHDSTTKKKPSHNPKSKHASLWKTIDPNSTHGSYSWKRHDWRWVCWSFIHESWRNIGVISLPFTELKQSPVSPTMPGFELSLPQSLSPKKREHPHNCNWFPRCQSYVADLAGYFCAIVNSLLVKIPNESKFISKSLKTIRVGTLWIRLVRSF